MNKHSSLISLLLGIATALALGYGIQLFTNPYHEVKHTSTNSHADHSMMMVKSEREFLSSMIPHHQEAVDTAKEVIARGGSTPEIKKLAEGIVVAQEKEITLMKDWYQSWYGEAYIDDAKDYKPMMRDLSSLSGAALDTVFLEDMIIHHEGAIMMAQSVQLHIEHPELKLFSEKIIVDQQTELVLMQELLTNLR